MARTPMAGLARVDVDELEPSPANPRKRMTGIDELAASLKSVGMVQPIVAQRIPGHPKLRIVAGHRRWMAAKNLGWRQVPVIIRKDLLPDEELFTMLVENGQRANLDPIEEARALDFVYRQGYTQAAIARQIGRSHVYVNQRLMLLQLPPAEQEALRAGEDTIGAALDRVRQKSTRKRPGTPDGQPPHRGWHFARTHPLADDAKARCAELEHSTNRKVSGSVACGECWEHVIRADERRRVEGGESS